MELAFKLPWPMSVGLALLTAITFHLIAVETGLPPIGTSFADLGSVVIHQVTHVATTILQFLVPGALLIGAAASFIKTFQRRSLFRKARNNPKVSVAAMSWRQFEVLVGEAFREKGFKVQETGGHGPDGGVDLVLSKNGERYLVQCKHWRSRHVGVTIVRELYGVMAAQGAAGGFIVASGHLTKDAEEFANGRHIELIDSDSIAGWVSNTKLTPSANQAMTPQSPAAPGAVQTVTAARIPICPRCDTPMVERVAKQGRYAGQRFWGCRRYPRCRGILQTE